MTGDLDAFFDDLFLGCAFAAWVDQAILEQDWPDEERTRLRAYRYFEEALAQRRRQERRKTGGPGSAPAEGAA